MITIEQDYDVKNVTSRVKTKGESTFTRTVLTIVVNKISKNPSTDQENINTSQTVRWW